MKRRATLRAATPTFVVFAASLWVVGSCYRAELELAPLLDMTGHGGVGGAMAGTGADSSPSDGGNHAGAGGDGSTAEEGPPQGGASPIGAAGGEAGGGEAPTCPVAILETWSTPINGAGSEWRIAFGDPRVDVTNHHLVVTYDDVAERTKEYEGSYYVTTTATLRGRTVLTPYPYSNEGPFPSLRRSEQGIAVELGLTAYGQTEVWRNEGWPTLGVSIPGTLEVELSTYVKAGAKAIASKVRHGDLVYRSAWVSNFRWEQTKLGVLRYVGENNSAVALGNDDEVYVGPLSGCERLSDAAVDELYAR